MKKLLLAMTATGALAIAAPAAAQWNTNANVNANTTVGLSNRIAQLESRLEADIRAGRLDRAEARDLRMDLRQIRRLSYQYSRNGLTTQERADLRNRIQAFRSELRVAGGSDIRYDRYGNPNRDVYDDGRYGRGGPYEDQYRRVDCDDEGVLDSIADIFGGGNNDDCEVRELRVGSRVTADLGGVPYQYRARFRDGNGVYYRSDGRNIYQIDARSHTVVRVYDVD